MQLEELEKDYQFLEEDVKVLNLDKRLAIDNLSELKFKRIVDHKLNKINQIENQVTEIEDTLNQLT